MSRRKNGTPCKSLIMLGTDLQRMRHEMSLQIDNIALILLSNSSKEQNREAQPIELRLLGAPPSRFLPDGMVTIGLSYGRRTSGAGSLSGLLN